MTSPIPSSTFSMPSPSTFSFPSTSEPVFSVSTSEPAFESPNSQTSPNTQSQQQFQQYHTTTVSNNNAKFPYLKKDEYETWAMKMEYWIMNSDHNLWNIVINGNSRKKTGRDPKGNIMILPPVSVEENIVVQRETKARTILLQSLPEDHMADFHHLDDARDIWLAVKARTSCIDVKGGSSFDHEVLLSTHSAFISAASTNSKMSYADSQNQSPSITFTTASSSADTSSNMIESVLRSFVAERGWLSWEEPKALLSADSMLNWLDHEDEDEEKGVAQVYGMIVGDDDDVAGNASGDVSDAAAEFALTGLSSQVKLGKLNNQVKLEESKARFNKWKESSKNLNKLINSSMSSRSKFGLGFGETFGSDEVFDPSAPSIFDTTPEDEIHASYQYKPDFDVTQVTMVQSTIIILKLTLKLNELCLFIVETCDKSRTQRQWTLTSCVSSVKSSSSKTNDHLASTSSSVDFKKVSKTDDQQPSSTIDDPSFSFKENVKTPRNICNKSKINNMSHCKNNSFGSKTCFVCGSKFYLIKDCDFYEKQMGLYNKSMWLNVANIPSFVPRAAYVPTGSRNPPTSVSASSAFPADSRNRPASVSAGRSVPAGWRNHAARPMTRPTSHYSQHFRRPGCCNQLYMDEGRWGTDNPHKNKYLGIVNSGCSRSMTCNKEKLDDFVKIKGGTVTFRGGDGKITRKGTIRTSKLNFENVYYVEELQKFNLFSVSQICDKKNKVLFTDTECLVLTKEFQLPENSQLNKKVKAIRCDNGTEFKNSKLIELCGSKGIKRDYSNARTPQQNGVAERKNRTLIEAARTMLADSKLPTMFWTEAVTPRPKRETNSGSGLKLKGSKQSHIKVHFKGIIAKGSMQRFKYQRVLVTRPHNKTPYELLSGKVPNISHLKPFGCHVTILNTSDHLGKLREKLMKVLLLGMLHIGLGQEWYFDLDYLTDSLGYTRFKSNQLADTQDPHIHAGTQNDSDSECDEQIIVVPSFPSNRILGPKIHEASEMVESNSDFAEELARLQRQEHEAKDTAEKYGFGFSKDTEELLRQVDMVPAGRLDPAASISAGSIDPAASISAGSIDPAASISAGSAEPFPTVIEPMEDIYHHTSTGIFSSSSYDADFGGTVTNLAPIVAVDPVPTKRVNTIHPQSQILGDLTSPVQTRGTLKKSKFGESTFVSYVHDQQRNNHTDYLHCLFACFLSQLEPSSVAQALNDPDWVEAMQEEMQQFINQRLCSLYLWQDGKICYWDKMDYEEQKRCRGLVVGKSQTGGSGLGKRWHDYDEVFALVARIEAIRLFLAFASYMGFMVYQMDVKSAFLYGEIDEEVYVYVDDIIFRSTKQAWCDEFEVLMKGEFEMSAMCELTFFLGLQVKQKPDGIFISQDKYVQDMLKKFDMESMRTATTPYEASKPKSKDEPDDAVNVYLYRSMIGSLMYLIASRPDIMYAVSACSRHQVTPLTSNLNAVKKIFKYLKGQPKLGLCVKKQTLVATSKMKRIFCSAIDYGQFLPKNKAIEIRHTLFEIANDINIIQISVSSGDARVPTGSFTGYYWLTISSWLDSKLILPFHFTNVADETLGERKLSTPLSPSYSELVQKVSNLESELQAHRCFLRTWVGQLVKKVKALELKLHTRSRKVVMSESDKDEDEEQDVDPLIKLAQAVAASDAHVDVSPGADIPLSSPRSTKFPTDIPSDGAPTGPSTVSPGSTTVPTSTSVPAAATIPANSGTTPETPSSPIRDARKGKGVAAKDPTPTHDKTFKQLEEERLGWEAAQRLQAQELADFEKQRAESLMKDANFARQMSQDFEMTADQRKRQQEVLVSAANYSDAAWDIILARLQANPDLSSTIFGVEFTDDDFAARMVELVNTRRKELAEQQAQERRESL
ncbi:putative ribonuclease H-like domain-containing protein [Tanacetum coccineum]